jgi:hypothetical protein
MKEMVIRSIYLESDLWKMIDEEAEKNERSGNKTVSFILKDWFKNRKTENRRERAKKI